MDTISSFIKRHPQMVFWGIAYLTYFVGYFMYVKYPSGLWTFAIWGTFLGGALVTAIADGRSGLKTYFSRIVRWRVGVKWYAVAFFLPLALRLGAFGLNFASGATLSTNIQLLAWPDIILGFLFIFFGVALGEEPGFRGFALPRLMVGRTALAASLILGVLHTIWHLPNFITGDDPLIVILIIISGAIVNTWMFNHTNGSVLIAMILHASVNTSADIFNPMFTGTGAMTQTVWLAVLFTATAILLPILTGRELGRRSENQRQTKIQEQPVSAK